MKHFIPFTILVCFTILSCKKDTNPGPAEKTHKVKTITDQTTGIVTHLEYDAQNRIQKIVKPGTNTYEFLYSPGLVTEDNYNSSGTLTSSRQYELNADGLIGTERQVFPVPAGPYNYTYNSSQQLTSETYLDGTNGNALLSKRTYYYSHTNLDSIQTTDAAGKITQRLFLQYYPGINNTISGQHQGLIFSGRQSSLAIKKQTSLLYDASGTLIDTVILNYTYETDAQGRITKRAWTSNVLNPGDTRYTYY